jgi:hypothetical protein
MNNLFHSGRTLGITLLAVAAPLCLAASYINNFDVDVMDRHWKSAQSSARALPAQASGELEQANGWLFYSVVAPDVSAPDVSTPVDATSVLDGYRLRLDTDWKIRVQAAVDVGRGQQRPLPTAVKVRMSLGISVGDRTGTAPFARYSVGIAAGEAGTFTELSTANRAAGRRDAKISTLGRRRPIPDHQIQPLVISYSAQTGTLTLSAGNIAKTIRRFRAELDRRGITDDFAIDLSSESVGIAGDRLAMFNNFSVNGAVAE